MLLLLLLLLPPPLLLLLLPSAYLLLLLLLLLLYLTFATNAFSWTVFVGRLQLLQAKNNCSIGLMWPFQGRDPMYSVWVCERVPRKPTPQHCSLYARYEIKASNAAVTLVSSRRGQRDPLGAAWGPCKPWRVHPSPKRGGSASGFKNLQKQTKNHLYLLLPRDEATQHNPGTAAVQHLPPTILRTNAGLSLSHQLAFGAPLGKRILAHESRKLPAKLPTSTATIISAITIVFHSPLGSGRHPALRGHQSETSVVREQIKYAQPER